MNIIRNRFVVMRKNRSEIWCGLAKSFYFKPVSEVNDTSVKTYRSKAQAESGCSSLDSNFEVVPAKEIIVINPMTNGDRIRSMTDEELANFVHEGCPYIEEECTMKGCVKCILEWLQYPVKEDS